MRLLVIGSGGREHAIGKKLLASPEVSHVFCAKGNAGMTQDGIDVVPIAETDHAALIDFAKAQQIDWVFIGPEGPLFHGLSDAMRAAGLTVFAPSRAAAMLECSKDFAKSFMVRHHIPTARYQSFDSFDEAWTYVQEQGAPIVVKADGLAAGKGVVVAETLDEAEQALRDILLDQKYAAQSKVVIESFLSGEEFSLFAFVKDNRFYCTPIAQDHKRAYDGDRGPNTGGMGAYCPVAHIKQSVIQEAIDRVIRPTVQGLMAEGIPYCGVLYAGLMSTEQGVQVIEFNARFGDPETQVVLDRLESDLAVGISRLLRDEDPQFTWNEQGVSVGVVVAADGYPESPKCGAVLPHYHSDPSVNLFYAGVREADNQLVSAGGRVLLVAANGETVAIARQKVYDYLAQHPSDHLFYRYDIGHRAQ